MVEAVFLLLVLVPVALILVYLDMNSRDQIDDRRDVSAIAEALGLTIEGEDELVGTHDGVLVRVYSKDHGGSSDVAWWTHVRCTILSELPPEMVVANQGFFGHMSDMFGAKDIQLGNDLDPVLRIGGLHEAEIRELLNSRTVNARLTDLLEASGRIELSGRSLEIRTRGSHLDNTAGPLRLATSLVNGLHDAGDGQWRRFAEEHELRRFADTGVIEGRIDGVKLRIELRYPDRPHRQTVVAAGFRPTLPDETKIQHNRFDVGDTKLGDPILDGMISVHTSDPAALAARISSDEVRGALLEVVHGYQGSVLTADGVHLVHDGRLLSELPKAVDAVVALVKALATEKMIELDT